MPKRIIYQTDEGGVAIIIPSGELALEEVARKDVPAGVPFKIIDTVEVPDDRAFRSAWEADMTSPNGVGVGPQAWCIEQYESEIAAISAESGPEAPRLFDALPMTDIVELAHIEDEAEKQAAYDAYLARVQAENDALTTQHNQAVEAWESSKAQRIKQLNKQIAVQQAEMAA